ncbi:hypothetical protein B0H13DRAFT_2301781 [Mycena leptocephala]|nr:hypothetical protein B0H13DRAFT_2301781 [Mycena leptocephala]
MWTKRLFAHESPLRRHVLPVSPATAFSAAYGLLIPVLVYRVFDKRWQYNLVPANLLRNGACSLHTALAKHPNTETTGLSEWTQIGLALGYLKLAEIWLKLVRAVLVNSTKGTHAS